MKQQANKHRRDVDFEEEDYVIASTKGWKIDRPSKLWLRTVPLFGLVVKSTRLREVRVYEFTHTAAWELKGANISCSTIDRFLTMACACTER